MLENHSPTTQSSRISNESMGAFDRLSYYVLLILTFLIPIFFVPGLSFPLQAGKVFLISLGTIVAFSLWVIKSLKTEQVRVPKGFVFYGALAVIIFSFVSTLFSEATEESLIGLGLETNTFFFVLILFLLLFTFFKVINSSKRIIRIFSVLFASFSLLLLYQLLRALLGADFLSFGLFPSLTSSPLGRWNDLATLSGLSTFFLLLSLQLSPKTKLSKLIFWSLLVLSVLALVVVNSLLSWIILIVMSLVLIAYSYLRGDKSTNVKTNSSFGRISGVGLFLLIMSVILILFRAQIGTFVANNLGISQLEARPSFSSTLSIAKNTLSKNPGFGAGLNRFSIEWGKNKPIPVNNTIFWDTNFNYGVGLIPTSLVTNGVLGFVAWIAFLSGLLLLGLRSLFVQSSDRNSRFALISSFFATAYLWTFSIFSVPGIVPLTLTFLVTGLFLSAASREGLIRQKNISFSDNSKLGFTTVFLLIVILILNAGLIYISTTRYLSVVYAQKALRAANLDGDLEKGFDYMDKALTFAKTDNNYRLMSQVHIGRLSNLLNNPELARTENGTEEFQQILGSAISNAQAAIRADEADHRNWLALGSIYEAIIPLQVQGAYENAKTTYERAGLANPTNPSIDLALARLEVLAGNNTGARNFINTSLQKKNNYTEAIFLLSQIEINEGNIQEATQAVEAASRIDPNNPLTFFQLGFLRFSQSNNSGAIQALERAVRLNPRYSNAKYFLGLAYYNVERVEDSIAQFVGVETLNPENTEVKKILENLRAGNSPLLNIVPSDEGEIESLPLQEL